VLEVLVLPNKWELQNLMDIKLNEKNYKIDNKYKDNFFFEKVDTVMRDIKVISLPQGIS